MDNQPETIQSRHDRRWPAPRWLSDSRPHRRRRFIAVAALFAIMASMALAAAVRRYREAPKIEPVFETIEHERAGPVRHFALRDTHGKLHNADDWSAYRAIVLLFYKLDDPESELATRATARLAAQFQPRGILFLAVCCEPKPAADARPELARVNGSELPVVFDPKESVAAQAGVRAFPEAVVLAPDCQVMYRGRVTRARIGDLKAATLEARYDLESAVQSIDRDELPPVLSTAPQGRPLRVAPALNNGAITDASPVVFTRDIAPILWRHCARCHRKGEVAPFPLLTYQDAAKRASFLLDVIESERMPPWKPHPAAGVFRDAPTLSTDEKEAISHWAASGCPPGDPNDLPPPPKFSDGWRLGEPDMVLSPPEPIDIPADGPDIYQTIPLRVPTDRDLVVVGLEFRPGNPRVVHHSRIHLDVAGDARRRLESNKAAGTRIIGVSGGLARTVELPYPGLGAWTPGMTPRFAPAGVGRVIPRGSDVVIQIHYHPSGRAERDQSQLGIFLAKKPVTKMMAGYSLCTDKVDIPAGATRHKIILSTRLKASIHLYSVVPHAHNLCREFRLAATLADGTVQPLLWITDWSLDWQDQYTFVKPVSLPKGTVITFAAYYDNSTENPRNPNQPPKRVRYGFETKDEMCACHLQFLPDDPSGYEAYREGSPFAF